MSKAMRSADFLVKLALSPGERAKVINDPDAALPELADQAKNALPEVPEGSRGIYYIVVIALGFVAVAAILGGLYLTGMDKEIPETVLALGSAAVGALAGLLKSP